MYILIDFSINPLIFNIKCEKSEDEIAAYNPEDKVDINNEPKKSVAIYPDKIIFFKWRRGNN